MRMLRESGVALAIITGRTSRCVEIRARNLGIDLVFQGVDDKAAAFMQLLASCKLEATAAAYMGDDVVDLPVLCRCGLALTVPTATLWVKQHADYVTQAHGGRGAAREVCELIMHAQGTLEPRLRSYLP
jgi:3-deoxy-D-manno-octulosonate 8-phosphate phosphatase (KDO 8-P phosphatase)